MGNNKSKILAQFIAGIFGGTFLGIAGFLTLMDFGGKYGCLSFIDSFFGTGGYESCGSFGAIAGVVIGAMLGIAIVSKIKITNYLKVAIGLLIGAFVLPSLYVAIMFWQIVEDKTLLVVPPVIFGFMVASIIPSLIVTGAINWRKIFSHEK